LFLSEVNKTIGQKKSLHKFPFALDKNIKKIHFCLVFRLVMKSPAAAEVLSVCTKVGIIVCNVLKKLPTLGEEFHTE
jgi:hypothetical protein